MSLYDKTSSAFSSETFGYLRLPSAIFRKCSEKFVWKSSLSGRKSSENRQKRRHLYVYTINRILHARKTKARVVKVKSQFECNAF